MSLASLARALGRSARSSRAARQGFSLGGLAGPRSPPLHGREAVDLGFVRGYLTSTLGSPAVGKSGDWRSLLANPQFRGLFSDWSKKNYENYYHKGKKEAPKGDGSNKSDSKQDSSTDDQWNLQDTASKQLLNIVRYLLIIGLMLSSLSASSSDQNEGSQQRLDKGKGIRLPDTPSIKNFIQATSDGGSGQAVGTSSGQRQVDPK
ncbi:hypothetical protein GUJ93_ZPchr0465g6501 [Zizania palustris]|uniref:Uncharacterized protein n=1 Tax=Zizania palustris TaxID=103762 RepID=A0A8J5QUG8_ZIZPA|nr:hypothetical protein GUJ93_ZPchr0465g6472 [Zizania palustris]KAG8042920.1 hypothetical protein GUJ93_ZPchr0465g6501 [Zizania palustris]